MQINSDKLWSKIPDGEVYPGNDKWQSHLLDQYKLYVEMADRISQRRMTANTYFLSVSSAVLGLVAYLTSLKVDNFLWLISLNGLAISVLWAAIIKSHKNLSAAKWCVVHELEMNLPARMYEVEWDAISGGRNFSLYRPISYIEMGVPWVFFSTHFFVLAKFSLLQISFFLP